MSRILEVSRVSNDLKTEEILNIFDFRCVYCSLAGLEGEDDRIIGGKGCSGIHASVLRAYQVLDLVKGWLAGGVPPRVVLELVAHIEELAAEHEAKGKR